MKLDVRAIAIAAGSVAAAAFIICGLFFRLMPGAAGGSFDIMLHANMGPMWRAPGWGGLLLGVIGWWVLTALCVGATAALYNRTARG